MTYLLFEHKKAIKNPIRGSILSLGNKGSEVVHAEFLIFGNLRASSWQSKGVEFRALDSSINLKDFAAFPLGEYDWAVYEYFKAKLGQKYDMKAVITDMVFGMSLKNGADWFCSEIVYDCLKNHLKLDLPTEIPSKVSPVKLYDMVSAKYKQTYL